MKPAPWLEKTPEKNLLLTKSDVLVDWRNPKAMPDLQPNVGDKKSTSCIPGVRNWITTQGYLYNTIGCFPQPFIHIRPLTYQANLQKSKRISTSLVPDLTSWEILNSWNRIHVESVETSIKLYESRISAKEVSFAFFWTTVSRAHVSGRARESCQLSFWDANARPKTVLSRIQTRPGSQDRAQKNSRIWKRLANWILKMLGMLITRTRAMPPSAFEICTVATAAMASILAHTNAKHMNIAMACTKRSRVFWIFSETSKRTLKYQGLS